MYCAELVRLPVAAMRAQFAALLPTVLRDYLSAFDEESVCTEFAANIVLSDSVVNVTATAFAAGPEIRNSYDPLGSDVVLMKSTSQLPAHSSRSCICGGMPRNISAVVVEQCSSGPRTGGDGGTYHWIPGRILLDTSKPDGVMRKVMDVSRIQTLG